MERFIGIDYIVIHYTANKFKIQYGEIYRKIVSLCKQANMLFKIQYGEIYSQLLLVL